MKNAQYTHLEQVSYIDFLQKELRMHNVPTAGVLMDALRLTLHELILIEERYLSLEHILSANTLEEAMICYKMAAPCLLHFENCSSECIIYHLLLRGWWYRKDDKTSIEQYMLDMQSVINEHLFGNIHSPLYWVFPINKDKRGMGDIKLANWRARKFMEHLDLFVNITIPEEQDEERSLWKEAILLYGEAIKVRKHELYSILFYFNANAFTTSLFFIIRLSSKRVVLLTMRLM